LTLVVEEILIDILAYYLRCSGVKDMWASLLLISKRLQIILIFV